MRTPDHETSNYGWTLWHLSQLVPGMLTDDALVHAHAAQARATLALVDETRGAFYGSTWEG